MIRAVSARLFRWRRSFTLAASTVLTLAGASTASAEPLTLFASKDAMIRAGSYAGSNFGHWPVIATRASDDNSFVRRSVLMFDTESTVPLNTTIQSARLVLTVSQGDYETRMLAVYGVPVAFEQGEVTWTNRKRGYRWTYPGGDASNLNTIGYATATPGSAVAFDVSDIVQAALNGAPGSRFARFLVLDPGAASRENYKEFHSSEAADPSVRPRLVITYATTSTPPPTVNPVMPDASGDLSLGPDFVSARAGRWVVEAVPSVVGGKLIRHPDAGLAKVDTALPSPTHYFEIPFEARAGQPYRLWVHGRADRDYWANDSVHVQFSGSVTSTGTPVYRIGTSSATFVNIEECSGCGVSGWQWQDNGYGARGLLGPPIYFATSGVHTIRVQTREDGLAIDRIVLSPGTYFTNPPTSGSTPAPAPAPPPDDSGTGTTTTLRVVDWNIHHGVGTDGRYDINRVGAWLIRWNPDVITLNETEKYTSYGNEDQPARFKAMLEQATGRTWYTHFAQEWGNFSSNGKGNLLLSRYPFIAVGLETLSYTRTMAIGTIVVNGRNITLMTTHLDPNDANRRYVQVGEVINIMSTWADPKIVTGDFNAWPDQASIGRMTTYYYDSWAEAQKAGTATAPGDIYPYGATRNGRIDYIFHSKGSATVLGVKSVQVPDTRDASGYMPSDHRPVVTVYEVR